METTNFGLRECVTATDAPQVTSRFLETLNPKPQPNQLPVLMSDPCGPSYKSAACKLVFPQLGVPMLGCL